MYPNIQFFIEDKTHRIFLRDFIKIKFDIPLDISFFTTFGSWSEIGDESEKIREFNDRGTTIVVFTDADIELIIRQKEFEEKLSEIDLKLNNTISYNTFYFPNNNEKGNIELLLLKIAANKSLIDCFDRYVNCISPIIIRNKEKAQVYAYLHALDTANKKIYLNDKRDYTITEHWDLTHFSLEPLKIFLSPFFSKN